MKKTSVRNAPVVRPTSPPLPPVSWSRSIAGYVATLGGVLALTLAGACFREDTATRATGGAVSLVASAACFVVGFRALRRAAET